FQAEAGIRDGHVTGVQTCALPISRKNLAALTHNRLVRAPGTANPPPATIVVASLRPQTFPNSDRLKAQLSALGNESDGESCEGRSEERRVGKGCRWWGWADG